MFPIKYLGLLSFLVSWMLVSGCLWRKKKWGKLAAWKGSSLSIAGRMILINSSLSSSFIYHISMYLLPKTTVKILDKQGRTFYFFGKWTALKRNIILWNGGICNSKKYGVLVLRTLGGLEKLWLSKNNIEMPYISEWRKYMIFAGTKIYQYTLVVSIFFFETLVVSIKQICLNYHGNAESIYRSSLSSP